MMEGKRTEGPWTRSKENAYSILTPQGGLIAKTSYHWVDPVSARLNAAFIVKACNEYEEMRAACVDMIAAWDHPTRESVRMRGEAIERMRKALDV